MKIRISNLKLPVGHNPDDVLKLAVKKAKLPLKVVVDHRLVRKSIDARRKPEIYFVYTVDLEITEATSLANNIKRHPDIKIVVPTPPLTIKRGDTPLTHPPVVVGMGPAGLFAALALAEWGYRPIVLERGQEVNRRTETVERFWADGEFDPQSNVQFGEGGAGTFSDGKLTTRINDPRVEQVLERLVQAGAPPEILYLHKPHIGTDKLRTVVQNLRQMIIKRGGRVFFRSQLTDLYIEQQRLVGLQINDRYDLATDIIVLAIGHSARDTYQLLARRGVYLEAKPFAVGVRVEHPQGLIDQAQFGELAGHPDLGPADYQLVYKDETTQRAAYTFCMCPGGYVVGAASEIGGVVTNGMSTFARDSGVANSAVVVSVSPNDFPSPEPTAGIEFQREWERRAFELGGRNWHAPAQLVVDFLADQPSNSVNLGAYPTYRPGVTPANLWNCLPKFVGETLRNALANFDRKLAGFGSPAACLTGVETRTSAPLRITRDKTFQSVNTKGLYPAGEGAGYAGGIVSAAVDGLRIAEAIYQKYALPTVADQENPVLRTLIESQHDIIGI
ncbi:MAG: hypothetical protein HPY81_07795 [Firmicutes bacterium]|nr:hypothetical protein [Bacillota bacterium]